MRGKWQVHLCKGPDGPAHGLVGNTHEPHGYLLQAQRGGRARPTGQEAVDFGGHSLQGLSGGLGRQWLVLSRPKNAGEGGRQQPTQDQIRIRHCHGAPWDMCMVWGWELTTSGPQEWG